MKVSGKRAVFLLRPQQEHEQEHEEQQQEMKQTLPLTAQSLDRYSKKNQRGNIRGNNPSTATEWVYKQSCKHGSRYTMEVEAAVDKEHWLISQSVNI